MPDTEITTHERTTPEATAADQAASGRTAPGPEADHTAAGPDAPQAAATAPPVHKKTPFFAWHAAHGAALYEKGGWVRPAHYAKGPVAEHLQVRSTGGVIDVHSMGKATVEGPGACALLDFAATNNIARLGVGDACYTCLCDEAGGIVDDIIVYRTGARSYYLITNTLSRERVLAFLRDFSAGDCWVQDVSSSTAYISVQGPLSRRLLAEAGVGADLGGDVLPYFCCRQVELAGVNVLLARTGYTGELGYELNFPAEYAADMWTRLCEVGAPLGIGPVGGRAMMSLRLEKGYRSYGADIDQSVNAVEAGLGWVVDFTKPDFSGRAALLAAKENGTPRRAVYLLGDPNVPLAPGERLVTEAGRVVGHLTSGLYGPTLERHVGLGYLDSSVPASGPLFVEGGDGGVVHCARRPFFDAAGERIRS